VSPTRGRDGAACLSPRKPASGRGGESRQPGASASGSSRPTLPKIPYLDGNYGAALVAIARILTGNVDAKADFVCHLEIKKFEDYSVDVDGNRNQ